MKKPPLNPQPPNNQSVHSEGANPDSPPSSLEEVRKKLQSFGYLNSRIERFYLASITRTASRFAGRLLLSFRIGILTGTVSALLMTLGTLLFNPGLLKKMADLTLVALYFEIFFVAAFTLVELALIYLVSLFRRFSGGRTLFTAGQAISFLAGFAFFAYFFYWGRTQAEYFRTFSAFSRYTILFILILSSIFVTKCTWLGFLVAFRESNLGAAPPNWRRYGLEAALALAAILVLVPVGIMNRKEQRPENVPLAVLSTSDRWIVIGVDGLSRELLDRSVAMGITPHLAALEQEAYVAPLAVPEKLVPPVSWTTIATGVSPAEHGILTPEVRRWLGLSSWMQITPLELALRSVVADAGLGQRQPVSGYLRKSKAFWEILSDSGLRSGIVNWWGSWPAFPLRGWNISERYYFKLASHQKPQDETYPAELFETYRPLGAGIALSVHGPELDRFYGEIFQQQLKSDPVRVAALYLPGLDILNYEFFSARKLDPFTYTDQYRQHLEWLDQMVAHIREENPGCRLALIAYQGRSLEKDHSVILIADGRFHGSSRQSFSEEDLAPLLLHSCGVPISKSMKADLIRAVFSPELLAKNPVRVVDAYPKRADQIESSHAGEFNDLLIEQMKSLGYLQ